MNAALKENIVAVAPHGRQAVARLAAILPHQEISFQDTLSSVSQLQQG
jgi:hypothetical protein